jgi:patatin-like phospholipase
MLAAFLVGYVPFALFVVPAMFRNTLVLTPHGLAWVTLFTVIAAVVVMATRRAVLLCGPARFRIPWPARGKKLQPRTLLGHLLLAGPIVATGTWMSAAEGEGEVGFVRAILAALIGAAGAAVFLLCASAVHAFLVNADDSLPDMVLPSTDERLKALHDQRLPPSRVAETAGRLLDALRPYLGPGYFSANGHILPPHLYALGIFATFAVFYLGAYFLGKPAYDQGVPALVFVLVLATFATIILAGVAFFLDRHHLPTFLPLAIWVALLSAVSNSDHYFALRDGAMPAAPMPYEIARVHQDLLTVVAVDGGGIQAAAWGAKVLSELERQWPGFHRSARLISSVSGGSVGTMYFVNALRPDRDPSSGELDAVMKSVTRGSLSEAGWGLAYPDLWRMLVPIVFYRFQKDRGWAIEQAWRRNFPDPMPTLGTWTSGVREGWRPAISLNATGVESGQRFSFGTFRPPDSWHLGTMASTYPNHDLDVPTAARLSATFPYITPIATAEPGPGIPAWHYADGGYYDNTGMGVAMRWLDTAMFGHEPEFQNSVVLFIRIRSSPTPADAEPRERAWPYGLIGPIQTLMSVRTAGQRERAETELDFLQRLWCRRGVDIRKFEFAFELPVPGAKPGQETMRDPPLSWQLTTREVRDLDAAWKTAGNQRELATLLTLRASPGSDVCTVDVIARTGATDRSDAAHPAAAASARGRAAPDPPRDPSGSPAGSPPRS